MAEQEKEPGDEEQTEDTPRRGKKGLLMVGGVIGLLGFAYLASIMAVPRQKEHQALEGPFVSDLLAEPIQVNLSGEGNKRYLIMELKVAYDAYDQELAEARIADDYYAATLKDVLLAIASQKSTDEVLTPALQDVFMEEIRIAIDPVLFPVHIGEAEAFLEADPDSRLRPGLSWEHATMRGPFYEHLLHVDGPAHTIQLDEGQPVEFDGDEIDLKVSDDQGRHVYVDVSAVEPDFEGDVRVGVQGRVRKVLRKKLLVQ